MKAAHTARLKVLVIKLLILLSKPTFLYVALWCWIQDSKNHISNFSDVSQPEYTN